MSSSSKAASINEHFERLVQKLDAPLIPFYPKISAKTAEGKGKIETKNSMFLMTTRIGRTQKHTK
jgi:hypothetical protein